MIHRFLNNIKTGLIDLGLLFYWYPVRKCLQALPLGVVLSLTGFITSAVSRMVPGIRKRLETFIATTLPGDYTEREIKEIAVRSIANYAGRRLEEMYLGTVTKASTQKMVAVDGLEHLETSVSRGQGTIILLSHFGSFLMPLPVLGFMDYKLNQLAGPPALKHHRHINEMIFKLRKKDYAGLPVTFLRTDIHLKAVVKALKNNELLVIAFDGREGDKWTEVNFLNKKAYFSSGPLRMAQVTGANIVPTLIIRQKDHTHRIVFEKPIIIDKTADEQAFSLGMQSLTDVFDNFVRQYPCHAIIPMYISEQRAKRGVVEKPIFA